MQAVGLVGPAGDRLFFWPLLASHDRTKTLCTASTSRCPICMGQQEVLAVHNFSVLSCCSSYPLGSKNVDLVPLRVFSLKGYQSRSFRGSRKSSVLVNVLLLELVPLRSEKHLEPRPQSSVLGVLSKMSDEHPCPL